MEILSKPKMVTPKITIYQPLRYMLAKLNIYNFKVRDIPVNPVYNIGEKSGIKIWKVIFTLTFLLFRLFCSLFQKYVIRDFHPLIFFYLMASPLLPAGVA